MDNIRPDPQPANQNENGDPPPAIEEGQQEIEQVEDEEEEITEIPNHLLPPHKRVILDQERFLPIANISRIMKRLLPTSGKVAKEAKECVQESVSEFISFLTSEACERCRQEKRKTISADDLMKSLINLGFDEYIEPMEIFMRKYREVHRITPRNSDLSSPAIITQPIEVAFSHNAQIATTSGHIGIAQLAATPHINPTVIQTGDTSQIFTVAASNQPQGITLPANTMNRPTNVIEPFSLMVDPQSNQHYLVVDNADGTQELRAVQIVTSDMVAFNPEATTSTASQFVIQNQVPLTEASSISAPGPIRNTHRERSKTTPYKK